MDITISEAELDKFGDAMQAASVEFLISGAMLLTPLRKSPMCCWIGLLAFSGAMCRTIEGGFYLARGIYRIVRK